MLGQSSRYLVKLFRKVISGKQLGFPFAYLNGIKATSGTQNQAKSVEDFLNLEILDMALQAQVCHLITTTMSDYDASDATTKVKDNELFYVAKNIMTKAHFKYVQLHLYRTCC